MRRMSNDAAVVRAPVLQGLLARDHPMSGPDPFHPDDPGDSIHVLTDRQLNRMMVLSVVSAASPSTPLDAATRWLLERESPDRSRCRLHEAVDLSVFWQLIARHMPGAEQPNIIPDRRQIACGTRCSLADFGLGAPSLFTATVVKEGGREITHIFAAVLAVDPQEARTKLTAKLGEETASSADVRRGIDPSDPLMLSLLSDASIAHLMAFAHGPAPDHSNGLLMIAEQRF